MRKITTALFFLCSFAHAQIWVPENAWFDKLENGKTYEDLYSSFIKDKVVFNADVYAINGLEVDCADLIASTHIIFAAIHKLPIIFYNQSGKEITNLDTSFNHYPHLQIDGEEKLVHIGKHTVNFSPRLISFINWFSLHFLDSTVLEMNSFPIKLEKPFIKEGVIYVHGKQGALGSGHSKIISSLDFENPEVYPIKMTMVSVPREIKEKFDTSNFISRHKPGNKTFNFRKFYPSIYDPSAEKKIVRVPEKGLIDTWGLDVNNEQFSYKNKLIDLFAVDLAHYINPKVAPETIIDAFIAETKLRFSSRMSSVDQAYQKCVLQDNNCDKEENYPLWDRYSSPSRDLRIDNIVRSIGLLISQYGIKLDKNLSSYFNSQMSNQTLSFYWIHKLKLEDKEYIDTELMREQGFEITNYSHSFKVHKEIPLLQLQIKWIKKQYSTDPEDHFLTRWGFQNFYYENI